jgi:hypothetical protein
MGAMMPLPLSVAISRRIIRTVIVGLLLAVASMTFTAFLAAYLSPGMQTTIYINLYGEAGGELILLTVVMLAGLYLFGNALHDLYRAIAHKKRMKRAGIEVVRH